MSPEAKKKKGLRKDGRIQRSIVIKRKQDGSLERKFFYGKTAKEADRKKEEFKARMKSGLDVAYDDITVSEWIDIWYTTYVLNARRKKPLSASTKAGYTSRIKQLKAAIGTMKMRDVRERHLQEALYNVNGKSKDAAAKYAGFVRRVFRKAKTNMVIANNPAEALDTPDGEKGHHRALARWEVDFILGNWREHRCGIWAVTMILTGMRRGELIAQDWKNIDLVNRRISILNSAEIDENLHFQDGPTKSEAGVRVLPICNMLYDALETIPEEKRIGKLCLNSAGKPVSPTAFRKGWLSFRRAMWRLYHGEPKNQQGRRTDIERKKLPPGEIIPSKEKAPAFDWRTHDMRFTFATAMYDAGVPVKAAQYYMGHADFRLTLNLYTQLSAEKERETNAQLVSFLDKWVDPEQKEPEKPTEKPDAVDLYLTEFVIHPDKK